MLEFVYLLKVIYNLKYLWLLFYSECAQNGKKVNFLMLLFAANGEQCSYKFVYT